MSTSKPILSLRLASVLLLALGALATAQAQEKEGQNDERPVRSGGAGFFAIGTNSTHLGPLNDRLSAAGYPTFSAGMLSVGGGGYGVAGGRLLLGGEGYGLITSDAGYQGRTVSVGGGYGLFTLGYLFRPRHDLRVFPQLGLGGGGLVLEIGSTGAADFDDVLENPNRSATVEQGSVLISLGAGVEYEFSSPGDTGGIRLGLRAGYLLSPYTSDWQLGEHTVGNAPDASLSGPFVRLTLGGGGGNAADEDDD